MDNNDYAKFAASWSSMVEMLAGRETSDGTIDMAFSLLSEYPIDQITAAMTRHCKTNKWAPAPCEIIEQIVGKRPTVEAMMGLAHSGDTTLGVFLQKAIGSYDLARLDDQGLLRRLKSADEKITDFIERAQAGNFTDYEIRMFAGREVDPSGDLCRGLSGPVIGVRALVRQRYQDAIVPMIEVQKKPDPTPEQNERGKAELKKMMESLR